MWKTKIFALILLLAVMTVVSGCIKKEVKPVIRDNGEQPIATSTDKIDIFDWQTYKNGEYGFELKYPKEWYWEDESEKYVDYRKNLGLTERKYYKFAKKNMINNRYSHSIIVYVERLQNSQSLEEYVKDTIVDQDEEKLFSRFDEKINKYGSHYYFYNNYPAMIEIDVRYVGCGNFVIYLDTAFESSKEYLDKIIDTIKCQL